MTPLDVLAWCGSIALSAFLVTLVTVFVFGAIRGDHRKRGD